MWDVGADVGVGVEHSERAEEDGGGGEAVHVVVGVDGDGLAVAEGVEDVLRSEVEVGDEGGVVEVVE